MRNEQGVALLTVLMVLVVLMLLGMTLIQFNTMEATQVQRQENKLQAHYLARSGLDVAVNYLDQQTSKYPAMDDLELEDSLQGALPDIGSYEVKLAKVGADHVRLSSRGTVEGRLSAEETIVLDVRVEQALASVDYARNVDVNWYKKTGHNNNQDLRPSTKESPLTNSSPVILDAGHKIKVGETHYLKAPAMLFSGDIGKELEIKNKAQLHLQGDYIDFRSVINNSGIFSLSAGENPIIKNGKNYGIVYFAEAVFMNNDKKPLDGITKGNYYLFEDGTTWDEQKRTSGDLILATSAERDLVFDFDDRSSEGAMRIVSGSFVYSSGTGAEGK